MLQPQTLFQEPAGDIGMLCREISAGRPLILASNRGPVEYRLTDEDEPVAHRAGGGVATALSSLAAYADFTWVASALGEGDRRIAAQGPAASPEGQPRLRFVSTPPEAYYRYYSVFSNPILWFLQHSLWEHLCTPASGQALWDAWQRGYEPVNRAFAAAIVAEGRRFYPAAPVVMLHDYHLYLAAQYIRPRLPHALLSHFVHIPWPAPGYWQPLPQPLRQALCAGLCSNDVVGFQTARWARNFLRSCQRFLPGARVDFQRGTVAWDGHQTQVRVYPISVDPAGLRQAVASPEARRYQAQLRPLCGQHTIVRVDRVDPSKNIVRGLRALGLLLEQRPALRGKVKMLAFLVPSRTEIAEYQRYTQEVMDEVKAINAKYASNGYRPIEVFYENNYLQALAGLSLYDVLLVNPLADGMNLVAKEGPVVNQRQGVLVLSEGAGAHEQLRGGALSVKPTDVEGMAEALALALAMPPGERHRRAHYLRRAIENEDLSRWLYRQLADLQGLANERPTPA